MSIFNFKTKTINKRYEEHCEEARSFIQVHYVRERGSDRYAFNTLTIKSDPEREKCDEWYESHGNPNTFPEIASIYLTDKKKKDSVICKSFGLDSKIFSSDKKGNVEKWEALAVCFRLNLNIAESRRLLKSEGYALTNSSISDLVIRYCIENTIYQLAEINYLLQKICSRNLNQL